MTPGAMQLTRIPKEAQYGAMAFDIPIKAVLLIEYGAINLINRVFNPS